MTVQRPPRLRKGATIGIISPSSNPEHVGIEMGIELLRKMGFKIALGDTTRKLMTVGTLAAPDKARAEDFNWAFENDSIDAVFCATGGYGSLRILDMIDFEMVKDNPKIFMGYSDITGFHIALNQLCGLVTFHGPLVEIDTSKGREDIQIQEETLTKAVRQLMGEEELVEIENPPGGMMLMTINEGRASGRLCGGNLTLASGTLGSEYEIDTRNKILVLEEVKETHYYIEFHLTQLKLCKKLDQARAIIMGEVSDMLKPENPVPSVEETVRERVGSTGRPALWGLCCGHGKYSMMLPLNAKVTVDASERQIRVSEGVVD